MDIQKIKKLKIDWLGKCPKCCSSQLTVETKNGSETWLYDGDKVACDCGDVFRQYRFKLNIKVLNFNNIVVNSKVKTHLAMHRQTVHNSITN